MSRYCREETTRNASPSFACTPTLTRDESNIRRSKFGRKLSTSKLNFALYVEKETTLVKVYNDGNSRETNPRRY